VVEEVEAVRVAGVALGDETSKADDLVPRHRSRRWNSQGSRRGDSIAKPQIDQVFPPVERTERMIRGRDNAMTKRGLQLEDRFPAVPDDVGDRARAQLAVFTQRMNGESALLPVQQVRDGELLTAGGVGEHRRAQQTLVEAVFGE